MNLLFDIYQCGSTVLGSEKQSRKSPGDLNCKNSIIFTYFSAFIFFFMEMIYFVYESDSGSIFNSSLDQDSILSLIIFDEETNVQRRYQGRFEVLQLKQATAH